MKQFNDRVNAAAEGAFTAHAVTTFGFILCNDLLEELTDPKKREIVLEAQEILKAVDDYLDPDGTEFETFEEISTLLDDLYKIIGFTREGRYRKQQEKLKRRLMRHHL